jgi:hypothetical protein
MPPTVVPQGFHLCRLRSHIARHTTIFGRLLQKRHLIPGNEVVDQLANRACHQRPSSLASSLDAFSVARSSLRSDWSRAWDSSSVAHPYHNMQPSIPFRPWFSNHPASRRFITTFIRLRVGHSSLPSSLFSRKIIPSASCPLCSAPWRTSTTSYSHVLPSLLLEDSYTPNSFNTVIQLPSFSAHSLLASLDMEVFTLLDSFLTTANIPI